MIDSHLGTSVPAVPRTRSADGVLRRLPELDSCGPEEALAVYEDISADLVAALDGTDDPSAAAV